MNPDRHLSSHYDYFLDLVRGDDDSADFHRDFYDEYNAVLDLPAEYYLDTVKAVFQDFALVNGTWDVKGELVRPQDIRTTALLTIEGELDDISGAGQTRAAHDLCTGVPPRTGSSTTTRSAPGTTASSPAGAGARRSIREVRDFIATHQAPAPAGKPKRRPRRAGTSTRARPRWRRSRRRRPQRRAQLTDASRVRRRRLGEDAPRASGRPPSRDPRGHADCCGFARGEAYPRRRAACGSCVPQARPHPRLPARPGARAWPVELAHIVPGGPARRSPARRRSAASRRPRLPCLRRGLARRRPSVIGRARSRLKASRTPARRSSACGLEAPRGITVIEDPAASAAPCASRPARSTASRAAKQMHTVVAAKCTG